MEITIPECCKPGDVFIVDAGDEELEIVVPEDCIGGSKIRIALNAAGYPGNTFLADDGYVHTCVEGTVSQFDAIVPECCKAGDTFWEVVDGKEVEVTVPPGCGPGSVVKVDIPGCVNIVIPEQCGAGDTFFVQVGEEEFEVVVPPGCAPGSALRLNVGLKSEDGAEKQKHSSLNDAVRGNDLAAEKRKVSKSGTPDAGHPAQHQSNSPGGKRSEKGSQEPRGASKSMKKPAAQTDITWYITVPEGCHAGETFKSSVGGQEMEITVPAGSGPGSIIRMDIQNDGSQAQETSKKPPAPATKNQVNDTSRSPRHMEISIPDDLKAGSRIRANVSGKELEVTVPEKYVPGDDIPVDIKSGGLIRPRELTENLQTLMPLLPSILTASSSSPRMSSVRTPQATTSQAAAAARPVAESASPALPTVTKDMAYAVPATAAAYAATATARPAAAASGGGARAVASAKAAAVKVGTAVTAKPNSLPAVAAFSDQTPPAPPAERPPPQAPLPPPMRASGAAVSKATAKVAVSAVSASMPGRSPSSTSATVSARSPSSTSATGFAKSSASIAARVSATSSAAVAAKAVATPQTMSQSATSLAAKAVATPRTTAARAVATPRTTAARAVATPRTTAARAVATPQVSAAKAVAAPRRPSASVTATAGRLMVSSSSPTLGAAARHATGAVAAVKKA